MEVSEKMYPVEFMGHPTHRGADYPYRDGEGNPFLPVVLYHAEKTGFLWDPYNASQMVYGSLTSAVLYSMWVHLVRDACWSQKVCCWALRCWALTDRSE